MSAKKTTGSSSVGRKILLNVVALGVLLGGSLFVQQTLFSSDSLLSQSVPPDSSVPIPSTTDCDPKIKLLWNPNPEPDIAGYILFYGTSPGGPYTEIPTGNVTTYTVRGLTYLRTYYFALKAVNTGGAKSDLSDEISAIANCPDDGEAIIAPPTNPPYPDPTYTACDYIEQSCKPLDGTGDSTCTPDLTPPDPTCLCEPPKVLQEVITRVWVESSTDMSTWTQYGGDLTPISSYDTDAEQQAHMTNLLATVPKTPPSRFFRMATETNEECVNPSSTGSSFFGWYSKPTGPSLWSRFMTYISSLFSSKSLMSNPLSTTPPSQPGSYKNVEVAIRNLGEGNHVIMTGDMGSLTIKNSSPFKASFPRGTKLSFTAVTGPNSTFNGWVGGCTAIVGRTCSFTVKEDNVIGAAFDYKQVLLATNISRIGTGMGGIVTSSYKDIECGAGKLNCAKGYAYNTFEVLTAVPNDGYKFTSWSGACESYDTTCTLKMDADKTVYAGFVPVNTTINVVGYYGSTKIAPNVDYVFIYEGQGTEMSLIINEEKTLQTWIVQSDLSILTYTADWTCNSSNLVQDSNTVCSGPNEAYISFTNFDPDTLSVEVRYSPGVDSVAPSAPETIEPVDLQQTSADITWSESQDNESIDLYKLYVNGVYAGFEVDTQERTETLWNLEPNTTYEVGVKALDDSGNESVIKTTTITTANFIAPIDGVCSATINTCTAGTLIDVTDTTTQYKWDCTGLNGGTTNSCTQDRPVNGVCSATLNTCTTGTFTDITDTATQYKWNCTGLNGGTTSSCMKNKPVNGVCSAKINTCTTGKFVDVKDTGAQYKWNCVGLNRGKTNSCNSTKRKR